MHHTVRQYLHIIFTLLCIITTLALIIWCCYEFSKNEDVCEVLFKTFHEDEDSRYPELTFGLPNRFNETALRRYDENFTERNYQQFLRNGAYWDNKMVNIDFEKVIMQLNDYEIETCFYESFFSRIGQICKNQLITIKRLDMFGQSMYTLQLPPEMLMYSATIKIKNSIFYDGIRPANFQFFTLLSYPNQLYPSMSSSSYTWPVRTNASTKNYIMRFSLKSMEVIRRRSKNQNECYNGNYDRKIMETVIQESGCSPSMWVTNRSEPPCKTRKSFKKILPNHVDQVYRLKRRKKYLDPCLDIEKLQIDFNEESIPSIAGELDDVVEGWFIIEYVVLIKKFKEIKQVRKYSIQSLVGNLGGYIGLCLGYAILNVPAVILKIWNNIKSTRFSQENSFSIP